MVGHSQYPNAFDTDTQLAHLIDRNSFVVAKDLTAIRDAIFSIERTLGIIPQGSFLTLADRFSHINEAFLPLSGGIMFGNLSLRKDVGDVSARLLLGNKHAALAFDEFSKNEFASVDIGTSWLPNDTELSANADPDGIVPFSIIGKNTSPIPDASGTMASSGRRKVKFYDDVHVVGNIYLKDFISTPRVVVENNVDVANVSMPSGPNKAVVKTLVKGGINILGDFNGQYGMTYLGGIMLKRWWTDPDWSTHKISEIPLVIPTDQISQNSWKNLLIMYSVEFHEENIAVQLFVNNKIVTGPILYSKLSNNRSIMNFVVLNKDNFDSNFAWTIGAEQSQSYLEQLNGTINVNTNSIRMEGTDNLNNPSKNENKFWNGSLLGNCYGRDILQYVDSSNTGNSVIRIGLKLAKHDIHYGSLFQLTPSYEPDVETNIIGGDRATCPDVRNIQILAFALNDAEIESGSFDLKGVGMINREDLTSAFHAVSNKAINPDGIGVH